MIRGNPRRCLVRDGFVNVTAAVRTPNGFLLCVRPKRSGVINSHGNFVVAQNTRAGMPPSKQVARTVWVWLVRRRLRRIGRLDLLTCECQGRITRQAPVILNPVCRILICIGRAETLAVPVRSAEA